MTPDARFETLIDAIVTHGFGQIDDFLSTAETDALARQLRLRQQEGAFRPAGIGQGNVQVDTAIRGDQILWLDETAATPAETVFWQRIGYLITYLNQTCFLGLREAEFHYASYPAGAYYQRHLDRFRTDSRRKLSVITYLNTDWHLADGGQLALYLPNPNGPEHLHLLSPIGGRLVCFESDRIEHEVLPATRERLSLTGWLKTA